MNPRNNHIGRVMRNWQRGFETPRGQVAKTAAPAASARAAVVQPRARSAPQPSIARMEREQAIKAFNDLFRK